MLLGQMVGEMNIGLILQIFGFVIRYHLWDIPKLIDNKIWDSYSPAPALVPLILIILADKLQVLDNIANLVLSFIIPADERAHGIS